ncbi:MAG: hypothetical protein JJ966_05875 [Balneolaceae bacterium]|nr:hypothetical protein [Balneolaceae bacterium]
MSKYFLTTILILFFLVTPVYGNAGSPMMWFGILHLFLINLLIGLGETKILNYIYKVDIKSIPIIFGNYVSMFFGLWFIAPHFSKFGNNYDFWGGQTNLGDYEITGFYIGFLSAFILSIVIEIPFFIWANNKNRSFFTAVKNSLLANILSNLVMFSIYLAIALPGSK